MDNLVECGVINLKLTTKGNVKLIFDSDSASPAEYTMLRIQEPWRSLDKRVDRTEMGSIMILGRCYFLLFVLPGAASETVTGLKGDSITFPCHLRRTEDLHLILTHGSKKAYGGTVDTHFKDRVCKNGSCDLILRDLKTTDAGRYVLKIYDNNNVLIRSYDFFVDVKVNLTGWKDKELEFDDMPREAESVVHITKAGREEVWRRGKSALNDRLIDRNGRLTIVNFTSSDEGTYRVLNSSGEILNTYIVTESKTGSKDTPKDETLQTEPVSKSNKGGFESFTKSLIGCGLVWVWWWFWWLHFCT